MSQPKVPSVDYLLDTVAEYPYSIRESVFEDDLWSWVLDVDGPGSYLIIKLDENLPELPKPKRVRGRKLVEE